MRIVTIFWTQLGGIVVWSIGFMLIAKGHLAKGLCELPIGLVANIVFYQMDASLHDQVVRDAFYRPDSSRSIGITTDQMDQAKFSKNLSLVMLPLFTVVRQVIKGLRGLKAKYKASQVRTCRVWTQGHPWEIL